MRALVTGGAGFIGRHLVGILVKRGAQVRVLDLGHEPALPADVEFIQGSITDEKIVSQAVSGQGWVFHLAANAQLWARDKTLFERVNHLGTKNILTAIARAQNGPSRIVCTATEAVLIGKRTPKGPVTLDETANPHEEEMLGPYCLSKYRAQMSALKAAKDGLPVVIVNPTLPMGPGDWGMTPPTRMLAGFIGGQTPAYLDTVMNIVDVRDAALGHILAAEKGVVGARYILGGHNLRMVEFLDRLGKISARSMPRLAVPYSVAFITALVEALVGDLTGRVPRAPLTGVRIARHKVYFDIKKAREELGFTPRALDDTLTDAVAWLNKALPA